MIPNSPICQKTTHSWLRFHHTLLISWHGWKNTTKLLVISVSLSIQQQIKSNTNLGVMIDGQLTFKVEMISIIWPCTTCSVRNWPYIFLSMQHSSWYGLYTCMCFKPLCMIWNDATSLVFNQPWTLHHPAFPIPALLRYFTVSQNEPCLFHHDECYRYQLSNAISYYCPVNWCVVGHPRRWLPEVVSLAYVVCPFFRSHLNNLYATVNEGCICKADSKLLPVYINWQTCS